MAPLRRNPFNSNGSPKPRSDSLPTNVGIFNGFNISLEEGRLFILIIKHIMVLGFPDNPMIKGENIFLSDVIKLQVPNFFPSSFLIAMVEVGDG